MYCTDCGKEITDGAAFCPNWGKSFIIQPSVLPVQDNTNSIAIIGFILSFFTGIAGLICSIIGCKRAAKCKRSGKNLAVAGIIISSIRITVVTMIVLFYILAFMGIIFIAAASGAG